MDVPYSVDVRPDTGLYNGRLAMWLFLASEAMLFGGLYSGYILLRTGTAGWPRGPEHLNLVSGGLNTVLLLLCTAAMLLARRHARGGRLAAARGRMAAAAFLGTVFLGVKLAEYRDHIAAGDVPARDNFFATYYVLTGVHALHVAGGVAVLIALLAGLRRGHTGRAMRRIEVMTLYWMFVEAVWLVLFPSLYLW